MIDICTAFGPLASMHAALDKNGAGMPCGLVARFPDTRKDQLEAAIASTCAHYPILNMRLAWLRGRPVLQSGTFAAADHDIGPLLGFASGSEGRVWHYNLVTAGRDTWLQAVWLHAVADGMSMLRFLTTLSAELGLGQRPDQARVPRQPTRVQPLLRWLPPFLRTLRGDYVGLAERPLPCPEVSWLVTSPHDRDRLVDNARAGYGGMLGWLAAAAARAFLEQQGRPQDQIFLNVPILRSALAETNGFGFGVGSLRFPVRVGDHPGMDALARHITRHIRTLDETGWDRNLERLLGRRPERHRRFAGVEAKRPPDPNITVSWKGVHGSLGAGQGPADIACFAAAPTLHVSAHADARGLSLSVTSRQTGVDRRLLLERIAAQLGCAPGYRVFHLPARGLPKMTGQQPELRLGEGEPVAA